MRLLLNVDAIHPPLTGIGHYALRLVRGLRGHPAITDLSYFAGWRWVNDPEAALTPSAPAIRRRIPLRPLADLVYTLLQQTVFRWQARQFGGYLLHSPNYILPPWSGPAVATVHDLSHLHYPQHHPRERLRYLARHLPSTLRRASRIIAVSEFTRQEIHQHLGAPLEHIITVHNGVDPAFKPRPNADLIPALAARGLQPGGYLLSVATLEPRKNLNRLVDAWRLLPESLRQRWPLALAGPHGWHSNDLERQLEPLERAGQIHRLGYIPQTELPALYAGARAFAYPALYEGFGLPVLEALASGTPVLTSNRSALPEVAGDAALLVEPEDVDALASGMERLLTDDAWRATASESGLQRASRFSWDRCVEETIDVYRAAAASFGI